MECRHCGSSENLHKETTRKLADGSSKRYYSCRACATARHKKYRATASGKVAQKRANLAYEKRNPLRRRAWNAVYYYEVLSEPCEVCGNPKVHKHHPDPENRLDVKFLCPAHHKEAHLALNKRS